MSTVVVDNPRLVNRPPQPRQTLYLARTGEGEGLVWIRDRNGIWRGWAP